MTQVYHVEQMKGWLLEENKLWVETAVVQFESNFKTSRMDTLVILTIISMLSHYTDNKLFYCEREMAT